VATRYNNASNNKDVVILIAAMADDCVVEKSLPRPGGTRFQSQDEFWPFWSENFKFSSIIDRYRRHIYQAATGALSN